MRESIAEEIEKSIRSKILDGDLLPNQRLVEREIQEEFGVSNSPVREAIRLLCAGGFAEIILNKGAVVVDYNNSQRIKDACEARLVLESYCAGKIAKRGDPEHIDKLESVLAELEDLNASCIMDINSIFEADRKFHSAIIQLAGNHEIIRIYDSLVLFSVSSASRANRDSEEVGRTIDDHRKILQAIKSNDESVLFNILKEHLKMLD